MNHKMHAGQGESLDTPQDSIAFCLIRAASKNHGVTIIYKENCQNCKANKSISIYIATMIYNVNAI